MSGEYESSFILSENDGRTGRLLLLLVFLSRVDHVVCSHPSEDGYRVWADHRDSTANSSQPSPETENVFF